MQLLKEEKIARFRAKCTVWGGILVNYTRIEAYWGMPEVTLVEIKNKKGTHYLVLDGPPSTYNNEMELGQKVLVTERHNRVFEITSVHGSIKWTSSWDFNDSHIGYNSCHPKGKCKNPGTCTHWVHFYQMSRDARMLFASLNNFGGYDTNGHYYWHPGATWGGSNYWEEVAQSSNIIVVIDTNQHFGTHLVFNGHLNDLKRAWKGSNPSADLNDDNAFREWLSFMKLCGVFKGWPRYSYEGMEGRTLLSELKRLQILE